jgi:hypothetical protein
MGSEDSSSKSVINASRSDDPDCVPEHIERKIQIRLGSTISGLVIALGGMITVIIELFSKTKDIRVILIGMIGGLIGAGAVDPNLVINFLKRER